MSKANVLNLSPRGAAERAAAANADYNGLCWQNTFEGFTEGNYPFWAGCTDAHKLGAIRSALVTIYIYLHYRSQHDVALEQERILFLQEIDPAWRSTLAKVLSLTPADLDPRTNKHPKEDLFAFAYEQETGAAILLEGYRREEMRRLEYKAYLLKNGPLSEQEAHSDECWARRNRGMLRMVEGNIAIADEARHAVDALVEDPHP